MIRLRRRQEKLRNDDVVEQSEEFAFYATSLTEDECNAQQLAAYIRGHWNACENGSHYRRDVTLGEDGSKIRPRHAAHVMASLRNLVLGLFELQRDQGHTTAAYLPEWQRRMTGSQAIKLIKKGG